jgi:glycosyltransferase involved in cell wall biosynthesis
MLYRHLRFRYNESSQLLFSKGYCEADNSMIIVSDCLTSRQDEGCLKIATVLASRMKETFPRTMIITYDRTFNYSDKQLHLNKLMINKQLFNILGKTAGSVLYIPFASNTMASIIRVLVLSIFSGHSINVLFALKHQMNILSRLLLRIGKANVIALSNESFKYYRSFLGKRAYYLRTGIDTKQFKTIDADQKKALRQKYKIPENERVILHVGHLKAGRNLEIFQHINEKYFVLIVVSATTIQDPILRAELEQRPNTRIIDTYIDNIQEIYQLSDAYLFPVKEKENCIDIPLSVLEAASCNIPVITTPYGELKELVRAAGFYRLDSCSDSEVSALIEAALQKKSIGARAAVLDYDWDKSLYKLESIGR